MTIGERIKAIRKQKKISVESMASALGVSKTTVYRYEDSTIEKIPVNVFSKLCDILGVSAAELMGNDVTPSGVGEVMPSSFSDAQEAMAFILRTPTLAAYGGYDVSEMSNETIVSFANDILEQLKLVSYKYNTKLEK